MMTEPASGIWREDLIENQVRNAQTCTEDTEIKGKFDLKHNRTKNKQKYF